MLTPALNLRPSSLPKTLRSPKKYSYHHVILFLASLEWVNRSTIPLISTLRLRLHKNHTDKTGVEGKGYPDLNPLQICCSITLITLSHNRDKMVEKIFRKHLPKLKNLIKKDIYPKTISNGPMARIILRKSPPSFPCLK